MEMTIFYTMLPLPQLGELSREDGEKVIKREGNRATQSH